MKLCVGAVLIVDDAEFNLRLAEALLKPYQLTVDTVLSGREAIGKIQAGHVYDIVFMDHMMPDMDGLEATEIIRGLGYTYPIVALTATEEAGQEDIFLQNGFDGFIAKPINMAQLSAVLHQFVRDIGPGDEPKPAQRPPVSAVMARSFVRDAHKAIQALEALDGAYKAADLRRFTIFTHGMKSALANIGEYELSDIAFRLEKAGRSNEPDIIAAETPAFLDRLRAVADTLGAPEAEKDGGEACGFDLAYLRGQLNEIMEACRIYDKRTVKALLSGLHEKPWPRAVKRQLNAMADRLLTGDFEEVSHIAGETAK